MEDDFKFFLSVGYQIIIRTQVERKSAFCQGTCIVYNQDVIWQILSFQEVVITQGKLNWKLIDLLSFLTLITQLQSCLVFGGHLFFCKVLLVQKFPLISHHWNYSLRFSSVAVHWQPAKITIQSKQKFTVCSVISLITWVRKGAISMAENSFPSFQNELKCLFQEPKKKLRFSSGSRAAGVSVKIEVASRFE